MLSAPTAAPERSPRLLAAITLFVLFDLLVLAVNFWITWQVEHDALAINVAGRQRMLTQRIAKSLLLLGRPEDAAQARRDLRAAKELFGETLAAFEAGGHVRDGDGVEQPFRALEGSDARALVGEARALWQPLAAQIEAALAGAPGALEPAQRAAVRDTEMLLVRMNRLTGVMQAQSNASTVRLRLLQAVVVGLALLNFALIVSLFRQQLRAAAQAGQALAELIDHLQDGVAVLDGERRIVMANAALGRLFGVEVGRLTGRPVGELLSHEQERDALLGLRPDGARFAAQCTEVDISLHGRPLTLLTIADVTAEQERQAQLRRMAFQDPLTSVPNRLLALDRLESALLRSLRARRRCAVLFIDLDGFKPINDHYGHATGDLVLIHVARVLQAQVRAADTVARYGGDEFLVILPDLQVADDAMTVAAKISAALHGPVRIGPYELPLGVSIGIASCPEHAATPEALIAAADAAMYRAKRAGGGLIERARPATQSVTDRRSQPG